MINIKPYDGTNFNEVSELLVTMMKNHTFKNVNEKSKEKFLGVFNYVGSDDSKAVLEVERALAMSDIYLCYKNNNMIGIIRGNRDNILNLFVEDKYQNQGIGSKLVEVFEKKCVDEGYSFIKLFSTVEAIAFYERLGFKKTTGMRMARYSGKRGYEYQPMMKCI